MKNQTQLYWPKEMEVNPSDRLQRREWSSSPGCAKINTCLISGSSGRPQYRNWEKWSIKSWQMIITSYLLPTLPWSCRCEQAWPMSDVFILQCFECNENTTTDGKIDWWKSFLIVDFIKTLSTRNAMQLLLFKCFEKFKFVHLFIKLYIWFNKE